jgi:hypothetical protein
MNNATPRYMAFMAKDLPCFEANDAWERANPRWISRMFFVPKRDDNEWQLIVDLKELIEMGIEIVYNMNRVKPDAFFGHSQLCLTGNV